MSPTRKGPPSGIHAAIYIRGDSRLPADVAATRRFAEVRDWAVNRVFEDVTPSRARRSRPAFVKLMGFVAAGKVQAVIVPRLSDVFCAAGEALEVLAALGRLGVALVSADGVFDSMLPYAPHDLAVLLVNAIEGARLEGRVMAAGTAIGRGHRIGRPRVRVDVGVLRGLLERGWPLRQVAREVRVGYGTVQRLAATVPRREPKARRPHEDVGGG